MRGRTVQGRGNRVLQDLHRAKTNGVYCRKKILGVNVEVEALLARLPLLRASIHRTFSVLGGAMATPIVLLVDRKGTPFGWYRLCQLKGEENFHQNLEPMLK